MIDTIPHKRTYLLTYILVFIAFLMSMRCWIGFDGRANMFKFVFPVLMIFLNLIGQVYLKYKKQYFTFSLIVFVTLLLGVKANVNVNGIIDIFISAFNIFLVLSILDKYKEDLFRHIVKWLGLLIIFGLPIYFLSFFTVLPSLGSMVADYGGGAGGANAGLYANYLVYIRSLENLTEGSIVRFNSVFIEPGDLGCVTAFIIMAAQYNFRRYKYLWAIMVGLLTSLSLAGYILCFCGYIFKLCCAKKISGLQVFLIIVFIFGVYYIGAFYNEGDNVINEKILSRLQSDDERGFAGNNRNSLMASVYFVDMWSNTQTALFGYDKQTIDYIIGEKGRGAGFVMQMINTGLIGIIGLCLPFLLISNSSSAHKYAYLFFIFFLLYMYQRTDAYWISIIICYVYGIVINERQQLK